MTPDGGKTDKPTAAPDATLRRDPALTGAADQAPGGAAAPSSGAPGGQPHPPQAAPVHQTAREDVLTSCLLHLAQHFGRPLNPVALLAGIPLAKGALPINQLERAAARAEMIVEREKKPLSKLRSVDLPAILLLKKGGACVLHRIQRREDGKGQFVEVFVPGDGDEVQVRKYRELQKAATGRIVHVKPMYKRDLASAEEYEASSSTEHWFWGAFKPSGGIYAQVIAASIVINLFALAMPLFIMNVYDRVVPNNAVDTLWALAIGVGIAALFDFILRGARGYFIDVAGRRADVVLANRVYDRVMGARFAYRSSSSGVQANTLREYETLRDFFNSATLATFSDIPFIALFIFVIWVVAGPLALVPLITVPIVIIVSLITQIPLNRIVRQSFQEAAQKNAVLFETLNGLETIKSTGAEGWAADKWEQSVAEHIRTGVKSRVISSLSINLMMASQMISTVALVVIGVGLIAAGDITPGALIAAVILNGRALAPLGQVAQVLTKMYAARTAYGAVKRVMETPQERPEGATFTYKSSYKGDIEFKQTSFTYPEEKVPALNEASFAIRQGEKVGLIGPIGSGKSTILKLILGMYAPTEGAVLIDGIDTGQLDPAILRSNMAYMPQHAQLFRGTIRSNVTIHAPHATEEDIVTAAEQAGAMAWLGRLPAGLDTPVGERGDGLSGGQRQSVALVRSLIKQPPILLLDEPTSEMDGRNEHIFLQQISKAAANRTVVLVTHRPAMLALVDRLILLDQGRVLADGPKDAILKQLEGAQQGAQGKDGNAKARTAQARQKKADEKPEAASRRQAEADAGSARRQDRT